MEIVRNEVSSRMAAALGNSLLTDLEKMGFLKLPTGTNLKNILFDKSKIDRSKLKVKMKSAELEDSKKSNFMCLGVDGRSDKHTKSYEEIEGKLKQVIKDEHHLTFTFEDGDTSGEYLTHKTIPKEGSTGVLLAKEVFDVLEEYNSVTTLKALLLDNTNSNTGYKGGLVVCLEKILQRTLHTVGCSLHWNELPLRAIFTAIDGQSTGPNTFLGNIGKQAAIDKHTQNQVKFDPIPTLMIELPPDVLKDMSNDQLMLYHYTLGINNGEVNQVWASRKCGPLNHARWLTLGCRIMACYTRTLKPTQKLVKLTKYIVRVYSPTWFRFKSSNGLAEAPEIVLELIHRLEDLKDPEISRIVKKNIQNNTYALLSENFIYSLVCNDDYQVRNIGLKAILRIRSESRTFENQPFKKIPPINFKAACWTELISLDDVSILREPPVTSDITDSEIQSHIDDKTKPNLPNLPLHSQSVERAVKLVTEASLNFYGEESRHQAILTKILSRKCRPTFQSKGHYAENYDTIFD